jgi:hypothetical protein
MTFYEINNIRVKKNVFVCVAAICEEKKYQYDAIKKIDKSNNQIKKIYVENNVFSKVLSIVIGD